MAVPWGHAGLRFADRQCQMTSGGGGGGGTSQPNPKDFLPPGQPQVAQNALNLLSPWATQGLNALNAIGPNPPATQAWPFVQTSAFGAYNNPFTDQALQSSQGAGGYFNLGIPGATQGIGTLGTFGNLVDQTTAPLMATASNTGLIPQAGTYGDTLSGQFAPMISELLGAGNAPGFVTAQTLGDEMAGRAEQLYAANVANANDAATAGRTAQGLQWGLGNQFRTLADTLDPQKAALSTYAEGLDPLKSQIYASAFDPQSALYNRTQQQLEDQLGAVGAMTGTAGTPYGAGVIGKGLSDFNIDWQNNQLGRQLQGANAISGITGQQGGLRQGVGTLTGEQGGLLGGAGGQYAGGLSSLLGGYGSAASLYGQGMGQLGAGQQGVLSPTQARLGAMNQGAGAAGTLGIRGLESLMSPAQLGFQALGGLEGIAGGIGPQALGLASQLGSGAAQFGGLPYQTDQSIFSNQLGDMSNLINLGNQQYTVPQMAYSNLSNYMGLGQAAEGLASAIAAKNFEQSQASAQGLGNLLGTGANLLGGGGGGGLFGGGRGGGGLLSGLFGGGGAGSFGPAASDALFATGGGGLEGASPGGLGFAGSAADFSGGGIDFASAAPATFAG